MRSKHAAARFRAYITAHESNMDALRATHFVGDDTLDLVPWPGRILMIGDLGCLGNITISVEKYLRVVTPDATAEEVLDGHHDIEVETLIYSYRAGVRGHGTIVRVDNNHTHEWLRHADEHHAHHCDWRSDDDVGRIEWLGAERWPTLGEFVRQVMDWYYEHREELPLPDAYATPLRREPHIMWNPNA